MYNLPNKQVKPSKNIEIVSQNRLVLVVSMNGAYKGLQIQGKNRSFMAPRAVKLRPCSLKSYF